MLRVLAWFWRFLLRLIGVGDRTGSARTDAVVEQLKAEFGNMSYEALDRAQKTFLDLAETRFKALSEAGGVQLNQKKELIDQQLDQMKTQLEKVTKLMTDTETRRETGFAQLNTRIEEISKQTASLTSSTNTLREALSSSRTRGQWGERMAEDILRLIGFIEGVNYHKQKVLEGSGSKPDFIFLLPQGLTMNMDVKFPLENYVRYLETDSETDRQTYLRSFLRDVKAKITEVSTRDYIDPGQGTVDYVLLFIPNESVYAFIHDSDPTLLDLALQKKVIWCSPLTLYCVLSVVRQAVDNFALRQTADEIIGLMGLFNQQWDRYTTLVETLGRRIGSTQKAYDDVAITRRRALQRPLDRIEQLRAERQIPIPEVDMEIALLPSGDDDLMEESGSVIEEDEE